MNSAQRRKSKREHPHSITLHIDDTDRYASHDNKVYNAVRWCVKNCRGTWKTDTSWDHAEFKFSNHKDATFFALKWL